MTSVVFGVRETLPAIEKLTSLTEIPKKPRKSMDLRTTHTPVIGPETLDIKVTRILAAETPSLSGKTPQISVSVANPSSVKNTELRILIVVGIKVTKYRSSTVFLRANIKVKRKTQAKSYAQIGVTSIGCSLQTNNQVQAKVNVTPKTGKYREFFGPFLYPTCDASGDKI